MNQDLTSKLKMGFDNVYESLTCKNS